MPSKLLNILFVFATIVVISCGGSTSEITGPTPISSTTPSNQDQPSPGTTVTQIAVSGRDIDFKTNSLQIGRTWQAVAEATYSDGTTRDVTNESVWTSADDSVATVSTTGTITGVSPGLVAIRAAIGSVRGRRDITVAPLGSDTFTVYGIVYGGPINGGVLPVSGVSVEVVGQELRTTTNSSGEYRVSGVPSVSNGQRQIIRFSADGYQTRDYEIDNGSRTQVNRNAELSIIPPSGTGSPSVSILVVQPGDGANLKRGDFSATKVYVSYSRGALSSNEVLSVWACLGSKDKPDYFIWTTCQAVQTNEIDITQSGRYLNPAIGLRPGDESISQTTSVVVYLVKGGAGLQIPIPQPHKPEIGFPIVAKAVKAVTFNWQ